MTPLILDTSRPVDRTGNPWCGPLVVAAILGTSTGTVAEAIYGMRKARDPACRHKRVARVVRGTYNTEMFALLRVRGYAIGANIAPGRWQPARRYGAYISGDGTRMARQEPLFSAEEWHRWTMIEWGGALPLWRMLQSLSAGTYIVNTPGHWALYSDGRWCETFTSGEWVDKRGAPRSSRKVLNCWQVTQETGNG